MGETEINQGFLPAEKIRLSSNGIVEKPAFGQGAREIFSGNLTAHFADPKAFAKTFYAKNGQNHQVLLALRYLRLLAMDYFHTHGQGRADLIYGKSFDPAS